MSGYGTRTDIDTCSFLMPIKRAHKISTVNFRHSSHLGTKSNYSGSTNVLLPSFTAFAPRQADDDNYHDKNTSLHVLLRTRKLDKKIHYCCRDSFFVEKDI